jgi:SAM-dependent methyltransferase
MPHRVCPWWMGYLLASPFRRLMLSPKKLLRPFVRPGMTILEPGPGMGFFTLAMAQMVGPSGRVIAVDIQPRMIAGLKRRAAGSGLLDRLDVRLAQPDSMGVADLAGKVDFALAFAVVHETPSAIVFFHETARALKQQGELLLVEPEGHVKTQDFESGLNSAIQAGLHVESRPEVRRSNAALLIRA